MNKSTNSAAPKYWAGTILCVAIGVGLLAFSRQTSDGTARFFAFSSGAFLTSGTSQIVRNLLKEPK